MPAILDRPSPLWRHTSVSTCGLIPRLFGEGMATSTVAGHRGAACAQGRTALRWAVSRVWRTNGPRRSWVGPNSRTMTWTLFTDEFDDPFSSWRRPFSTASYLCSSRHFKRAKAASPCLAGSMQALVHTAYAYETYANNTCVSPIFRWLY